MQHGFVSVWAALSLAAAAVVAAPLTADRTPPIKAAITARRLTPGELVVVTVRTPPDAERVQVAALDEQVAAYEVRAGVWRALVGIDLEVAAGSYPVVVEAVTPRGTERSTTDLRVKPKHFAIRRLRVDEAFVNPPASAHDQIARDVRDLQAIWSTPVPRRLWRAPFVRPVPGAANSRFGTRSIFNGEPRNPHGGADLLSPAGTPVAAPAAGRIRLARDLYYSGNTVVIDHGLGVFSLLAHLSSIEVAEGQEVAAGAIVGRVGSTGRVTGPHLHWAVRVSGARVDPLSLLALLGKPSRIEAGD